MTMNSSGPISLGGPIEGESISIQNGGDGTTQISLDDAAVRTLAGVPSGQIVMPDDFWGKGAPLPPILLANLNLRTYALSQGWDGVSAYTATFNSRTYVYSTSTGNAGLIIDGSWPNGVTVINNGFIQGKGGNGGSAFAGAGSPGGPAISTTVNFNLVNNSFIGGGGGGGGGGRSNAGGAGGGGGGAGGGNGGNARFFSTTGGGAGGLPAQTGSNGSGAAGGGNFGGGGGGGIMPGAGGGSNAGGGAGGGGGTGFGGTVGGIGGSAGSAGQSVTGANCQAGGGGGGWGASGGNSNSAAGSQGGPGGAGGKAIELNGNTVNLTGSGVIYGVVS
jgi:hypothetical protein